MKKPSLSLKALEPLFDKVGKLSRLYRILISIAIFSVLIGPYVYFSIMPKQREITRLNEEYEKLDNKLRTLKIKARKLKRLQAELAAAQDKFKIARRALPDQKDIPSLLAAISNSGQESGLDFLLFQPAPVKKRDFFAEIPITLNVEGSYHNTALFFDRVARLPRIVNVSNLRISQREGTPKLGTSLTASTYQFIEQPPPPPPKAKKKRKKKKKK